MASQNSFGLLSSFVPKVNQTLNFANDISKIHVDSGPNKVMVQIFFDDTIIKINSATSFSSLNTTNNRQKTLFYREEKVFC